MKKQGFYIDFFCLTLFVVAEIEKPESGTFDTPSDNGSITIVEMYHLGVDIYPLIEQIPNYDELIIDEIRKQL